MTPVIIDHSMGCSHEEYHFLSGRYEACSHIGNLCSVLVVITGGRMPICSEGS